MDLKGKKVLVTGGSSGYGKGIAAVLSQAGAEVWITGRNEKKLQETAEKLQVKGICADVSCGADWDRVIAAMGGDMDVLINNAGAGGNLVPVSQQRDEDIISTININLTGTILGCSRAARIMEKKKAGTIINISSVCALYAWPAWSIYTAAKAGLAKFSHGLYTELRPFGVRVTCLTPSWGQTNFNAAANISGASENPELAAKCTSPEELGVLVKEILETPDHLAIPDVVIQPVIQDICPM
ncbi:MAG: SDR family NAD(P)-dependent oxidoreductase [Lentisphaeria bacterium]|nr:SDR family NAD(P)-dependent oxidoreductase [Lentisphaeria bacterium]